MNDQRTTIMPVNPVSVVNQVTERIRHSIVCGELPPGSFSITDLATRLGVSHIPVREALRRLETEGLVTLRPTRGGEVRAMNRADVEGIYRLRLLFEPPLAAEGTALLTDADFEELRSLLRQSSKATTVDERMTAHRRFHLGLVRKAMTEWDLRIWDYLFTANERYARLLFASHVGSDHEQETQLVHEQYLDIVETHQAKKIRAATVAHLERNQSLILALLEQGEQAAS